MANKVTNLKQRADPPNLQRELTGKELEILKVSARDDPRVAAAKAEARKAMLESDEIADKMSALETEIADLKTEMEALKANPPKVPLENPWKWLLRKLGWRGS